MNTTATHRTFFQRWSVLLAFLIPCVLFSQVSPAGVEKPVLWLSQHTDNGVVNWKENQNGFTLAQGPISYEINAQKLFQPDITKTFSLPFLPSGSQLTVFPVLRAGLNDSEQMIWKLSRAEGVTVVAQTDQRFADFERGSVLNTKLKSKFFQLPVYETELKLKDTALKLDLFGDSPYEELTSFSGNLPEFIVFDRSLSLEERIRIETYLALKYSIPLYQQAGFVAYLGSDGSPIFDNQSRYLYQGFGLAKDHINGFQSLLSNDPGEVFSISSDEPAGDLAYLVIAADKGEKQFVALQQEQVETMERSWKIQFTQWNSKNLKLQLQNENQHDAQNKKYFLKLNSRENIDIIPLTINENEAFFDLQSRGSDASFSLLKAPPFFAFIDVDSKDCAPGGEAVLKIQTAGGRAPFSVRLTSLSGIEKMRTTHDKEQFTISLSHGDWFEISISDALGQNYQTVIPSGKLNSSDQFQVYEASSLDELDLDLPANQKVVGFYSVSDPGNNLLLKAETGKASDYWLAFENENACISYQKIRLRNPEDGTFNYVLVTPNPGNGQFTLEYEQAVSSEVEISIYDSAHRQIDHGKLGNGLQGRYHGYIKQTGIYFIEIRSGKTLVTKKLVVI